MRNALLIFLVGYFQFWILGPERIRMKYRIQIKPLLHWCLPIRDNTGCAISLRIGNHQCNNVLVFNVRLK